MPIANCSWKDEHDRSRTLEDALESSWGKAGCEAAPGAGHVRGEGKCTSAACVESSAVLGRSRGRRRRTPCRCRRAVGAAREGPRVHLGWLPELAAGHQRLALEECLQVPPLSGTTSQPSPKAAPPSSAAPKTVAARGGHRGAWRRQAARATRLHLLFTRRKCCWCEAASLWGSSRR